MRLWKLCCLTILVSACSQFQPFEDTRREAGQVAWVGQSTKERIAICYNPLWSDMNRVEELAQSACQKQNKKTIADGVNYFSCRFVNPATAFYLCK